MSAHTQQRTSAPRRLIRALRLVGSGLVLAATIGSGLQSAAAQGSPPNILLVLVDDLGIEHLGAYGIGSQFIPTPNLDQLASGGLVFLNAWSNPICSPTRVTIQTGRYGLRTGVGSNVFDRHTGEDLLGMQLSELTLPELLKLHVPTPYATAAFGKWHMGADASLGGVSAPNLAGYDHFEGALGNQQSLEGAADIYYQFTKTANGANEPITSGYSTSHTVDWAINWINETSGPWFAYVALLAPHKPFHFPPSTLHSQDTSQEGVLPRYRAMTEAADTEIGRLLGSIDTTNTLIVFASDNGSPPEVALPPVLPNRAKGTVFQGGIRVPMVIAGDMVTAGDVAGLVNLADLYATIAEAAGATIPATIEHDSESLVPYFSQPGLASIRDHAYTEIFSPNGFGPFTKRTQVARNGVYKYLRTLGGAEGLSDLSVDPWETDNLLAGELTPEQQEANDELVQFLDDLVGVCSLAKQGERCQVDDDCCSGRCRGSTSRRGRRICKDLVF